MHYPRFHNYEMFEVYENQKYSNNVSYKEVWSHQFKRNNNDKIVFCLFNCVGGKPEDIAFLGFLFLKGCRL